MAAPIAWIDVPDPEGSWGPPGSLALPLSDRGLLLADGLFETLLVEAGRALLLEQHLERWRASANLLALPEPPGAATVIPRIEEAVRRSGITRGALRLNLSRGTPDAGARGIDLPAAGESPPPARFWLQLTPCHPGFEPLAVMISRLERRNADSLLSRCKTFAYGGSIQARREARARGADDALLLSTTGEVCCGTTASLLLQRDGRWLTPPLSSGCLPGVMRGRALARGLASEARLEPADLEEAEGLLLINSLGCRPVRRCETRDLPPLPPAEAERLWRSLLAD
ncbi:aminotransferase class IV [Cyanobium sp. FGCU-6]|nr:aminotransferase class IV [Cyanobium sp. FGCU6]